MSRLAAGLALLIALAPPAHAVPITSSEFGFYADFPAAPVTGEPADSETDDQGNVISRSVMISDQVQGVYFAAVLIDRWQIADRLNVAASLLSERDAFLKPLHGVITSANNGTVDGNQAAFFSYTTTDGNAGGDGIIVIVESPKPSVYLLVTTHTVKAGAADLAALERFKNSFRLMPVSAPDGAAN